MDAAKRWSATELELNRVVFSWQTFKPYILGRHVKVYSDHMTLKGIRKMKDTASRIMRLQQKLLEFDYEIIYKVGKENNCADFLSRNPMDDHSVTFPYKDVVKCFDSNVSRVRIEEYDSDDSLDEVPTATESYKINFPKNCGNDLTSPCFIITRQQAIKDLEQEKEFIDRIFAGETNKTDLVVPRVDLKSDNSNESLSKEMQLEDVESYK